MKKKLPIILILLCFLFSLHAKEVDTFNILLPTAYHHFYGHPRELISTSGQCYHWQSGSEHIVTIVGYPLEGKEKCSKNGLVELVKVGTYKLSTYIKAKDAESGEVMSIPIRVHDLNRISIFTKSKVMNLNEIQTLEVYGFDQENNTFTSLEGLRFEWLIYEEQGQMSKVGIEESSLFLPLQTRKNLESDGFETDILVVKAMSVGKLRLKVRCVEDHYQQIEDEIVLFVHERFQIVPSFPLNMIAGSTFQFYMQIGNEKTKLPIDYYSFQIGNGFHSSNELLITAPSFESKTVLRVMDERTSIPFEVCIQIYSFQPEALQVSINEYIIVGIPEQYKIEAYSKGKKLFGNTEIEAYSDFYINADKKTVIGEKKQEGKITFLYENLKVEKRITSFLPLMSILPTQQLLLPVGQTFSLKVIGGSGYYIYKSEDRKIADVDFYGEISTRQEGQTTILVRDQRINENQIKIKVKVEQISSIENIEKEKEANLNQETVLFIKAKNKDNKHFTSCHKLPLHISQTNSLNIKYNVQPFRHQMSPLLSKATETSKNIFEGKQKFASRFSEYINEGDISENQLREEIDKLENYGICCQVHLTAFNTFDGLMTIQTEKYVRTKLPFRVYEPFSNYLHNNRLLLTPSSSFTLKTKGGSYSWPDSETQIFLNHIPQYQNSPELTCPNSQQQKVYTLEAKNIETTLLLQPVEQKQQILLKCEFPTSFQLFSNEKILQNRIYLLPGEKAAGQVKIKNRKNEYFDKNSLILWNVEDEKDYMIIEGNNWQYINSGKKQMNRVQINSFQIKKGYGSISFPKISNTYEVFTLNPISFDPSMNVLRIPNIKQLPYWLKIQEGKSRSLSLSSHDDFTVQAKINVDSEFLILTPISVGRSKITVTDSTVLHPYQIQIMVEVYEVTKLTISTKKSQYLVGEEFQISFNFYSDKILLSHTHTSEINLHGTHILQEGKKENGQNIRKFKGSEKGQVSLVASLKNKSLKSNSLSLLIYDPISINFPAQTQKIDKKIEITLSLDLLVSCKKVLRIEGGPQNIITSFDNKVERVLVQKNSQKNYEILGIREGKGQVEISIYNSEMEEMGRIFIAIEVSEVDNFDVLGISSPLKGSQFRLLSSYSPSMRVSECNFQYFWRTSQPNSVFIQSDPSLIGINVTAKSIGQSLLTVDILSQKGKMLGSANKVVKVIQKYEMQVPLFINETGITTPAIILPPNSGFIFEQGTEIQKIKSSCSSGENSFIIERNKIITKNGISEDYISLTEKGRMSVHSHLIIRPVSSIFVENKDGLIKMSKGQQRRVKFYLLDAYGRLFFNNSLLNVQYNVEVSNLDIAEASISSDRQFVDLLAKDNGKIEITLSIEGYSIFDVVPVMIQTYIEPSGNFFIHVGDKIKFTAAYSEGQWQSSNPSIINIDPLSGWALAKKQGIVSIRKGEGETSVNVFRMQELQKVSKLSSITKFAYKQVLPEKMLDDERKPVQKNTHWQCEIVGDQDKYFSIQTFKEKDIIFCEISPKGVSLLGQTIQISVNGRNKNVEFSLSQRFIEKISSIFVVLGSHRRNMMESNHHKVIIETEQKLQIAVIDGEESWILFDKFQNGQQFIQIGGENVHKQWKLLITNPATKQQEFVHFQIGEVEKKEDHESGWSWVDLMIFGMLVNFLIIILINKGGQNGRVRVY